MSAPPRPPWRAAHTLALSAFALIFVFYPSPSTLARGLRGGSPRLRAAALGREQKHLRGCLREGMRMVRASEAKAEEPTREATKDYVSQRAMMQAYDTWQSGYRTMKSEFDQVIKGNSIIGEIPPDLQGTLFRNGPAIFETLSGKKLIQPFDGDGMAVRISFEGDGSVRFTNRLIMTDNLKEELEAGKALYAATFSRGNPNRESLLSPPFSLNFKNVANTGIILWANELYALWEAGNPHKMDPHTLETIGSDTLTDLLTKGEAFAAHYRIMETDEEKKKLISFGTGSKGLDMDLRVFEFDPESMIPSSSRREVLPKKGFAFLHDFVVTADYYVFHLNPIVLDLKKVVSEFFLGRCAIAECLKYQGDQKGEWLLIPRDPNKERILIDAAVPQFIFHHGNAFQRTNEKGEMEVVVDHVGLKSFDFSMNLDTTDWRYFMDPGPRAVLKRTVINLNTQKATMEVVSERGCEFPQINPSKTGKPYRYIYTAASAVEGIRGWGPNRAIQKYDLHTRTESLWVAGVNRFPGEPIFVPKKTTKNSDAEKEGEEEEDAGYILSLIYDGEDSTSSLVILDAQKIENGPIAEIILPTFIPHGLHGSWAEGFLARS